MRCIVCGVDAPLLRNRCKKCDPYGHKIHDEELNALNELMNTYEKTTGQKPLGDWDNFEKWMINNG